jgi:hypothetical protein
VSTLRSQLPRRAKAAMAMMSRAFICVIGFMSHTPCLCIPSPSGGRWPEGPDEGSDWMPDSRSHEPSPQPL